ncbi:Putative flippase GtrA (transmembrane translocase of bactoprenol-linked glucose) [Chitinophaga eiseniae]|uniref:Putative flippase GtrA (Transmembrane translocase of bactoprenol-linked glucose) n=1 Tax=Chitinophaga eiseniae TaxID=634771 RepID=A0A1T4KGG7_9BACT|nr:GtrA family protein [Chitinophaga eiseniae]SJZ41512.1 Putative flippase GtrA (transmembrane translocase of bactoprenol-linked glucose) [Chitinophaga eiseniae]
MLRRIILQIIDFFYQPFARVMPRQTFRYLACGGGNTAMDILLYFICYNFVLQKEMIHLPFIDISAHIAALFMSMAVTFPTGFLLSKYVVFSDSNLRGRVQLFRYFLLVGICILLNYFLMKLFVDRLHFYPTIGKIFTTALVVIFSYLTQKKFTFKVKQQSPG